MLNGSEAKDQRDLQETKKKRVFESRNEYHSGLGRRKAAAQRTIHDL